MICGAIVSGSYFAMLGVKAATGRLLAPSDDRPDASCRRHQPWLLAAPVCRRPSAVGRTIRIARHPVTIVGVAWPASRGSAAGAPLRLLSLELYDVPKRPSQLPLRGGATHVLEMIARLRPGTSIEQAQVAGEPSTPARLC